MNKLFITEISEEDFRKLDLTVYHMTIDYEQETGLKKMVWKEIKAVSILDGNIAYLLETNPEALKIPFTFAVHKDNGPNPKSFYFDKFMNRFTGAQTYQFGFEIKHLFSTRDYFECHDDHWRVLKRETKAIYRVHLDLDKHK